MSLDNIFFSSYLPFIISGPFDKTWPKSNGNCAGYSLVNDIGVVGVELGEQWKWSKNIGGSPGKSDGK